MTSLAAVPPDAAATGTASLSGGRRKRRIPLAFKFAAALIGLVTLILISNGAVNLWLNGEEAKRAVVGVQQEKARAAAERVDGFISDVESQIGWTTRAEWRRVPLEQQRYDFIRLLRQAPAVTEVSYIDPKGKEQLKVSRLEPDGVGSGKDFSAEPRFVEAVAKKVWFGPVTFRRGSEPYMTIAVAHAGRDPGVTTAEVNLKLVWDVITGLRVGEKGLAFVVTGAGRLIAHPDLSLVLRDTDFSSLPQVARALPTTAGQATRAASAPEINTDFNGQSVLTASAPISRLGWVVLVQSPVSEALAPVYATLYQTLALLGFGLLLATVAGSFLARRMVVPIRRLQEGAERLGGGDLSQRISIQTGDEIETLADRFNAMAGRVQESYETLEAKVEARTHDLNEALEQQTATAEVLKVISRSAFDLDAVLQALLEAAARLCDASICILFRRSGDVMMAAASHGGSPDFMSYLAANPHRIDRATVAGRAAVEGKTIHIPDIAADTEYALPKSIELGGWQSIIGVPLLRNGEVIGVLDLARPTPGPFNPRQIELVESFADQAVIAIENARLFEEVQAKTKDLEESLEVQTATGDVLSAISRSPDDLKPVLETIAHTARRVCRAEDAHIYMLADEEYRQAVSTRAVNDPWHLHAAAVPITIDMRGSATARAAREHRTIHIPNTAVDVECDEGLFAGQTPRTVVSVPLIREGATVGVITLNRATIDPFTTRELELLATFADQAVIAIANTRLFEEVQARTRELQASLENLRTAQDRLVQSEKLASLGQLTAGIAHEIKNPLNFVNNFSALSSDLIDELTDILAHAALDEKTREDVEELAGLLKSNLAKVVQHGKRADSIVRNMLLHSREGSGERRVVEINALVEESMNLAYHGARAEKPGFNVSLAKVFDPEAGEADLFPQEVTRVLLNLITNGFYAASKRKSAVGEGFEPMITATTRNLGDRVEIRIRDNGTGIPDEVKAKIFNPFFTTKPAGEGTGLGLSLSHDIVVKQHGGILDVATVPGDHTEFTIVLPRGAAAAQQADKS